MNAPRWTLDGRTLLRDDQPTVFISRAISGTYTWEAQRTLMQRIVALLNADEQTAPENES